MVADRLLYDWIAEKNWSSTGDKDMYFEHGHCESRDPRKCFGTKAKLFLQQSHYRTQVRKNIVLIVFSLLT